MITRLRSLPLIVILMGIGSLSMLVPATYGYLVEDMPSARVFLYGTVLFFILSVLIGIATINNPQRSVVRSHLLALLGTYLVLPVMLAVPFYETVQDTRFVNAYFEMLSSLTTTGATLYDDPRQLPNAAHLWRALVGWMGGFFIWITAIAILAPLNLGGFEVTARQRARSYDPVRGGGPVTAAIDPSLRLTRHARALVPIYVGLTLALWIFLVIVGEDAFVAACHAMSTLSTSGISPLTDLTGSQGGLAGEALIFIFLFFAISRLTFSPETQSDSIARLSRDPEFRMGIFFVLAVSAMLFMRHWVAAYEIDEEANAFAAIHAFWGSAFTVMSFLTTTGFESSDWAASRFWSGLETPGLILVGLAMIGGGVATTAGGVKLLRVYALYKHGLREIERLVHPSSIGGSGSEARHLRNRGAYLAWIAFMLFALSIGIIMSALSLTGLEFDAAIILTIAALSTTGPLAGIAAEPGISYTVLGDPAKLVLCAAMVIGRLETLAIIALLSPEFWRR